jgi:NosR/NirI family nitrous oxide reductase transcriptional regulator
MRIVVLTALLLGGGLIVTAGQSTSIDPTLQAKLRRLFPSATSFSPKGGDPPHFKAYTGDPRTGQLLAGFAFWTTELQPLERGYDGPIKILVGMNTKAVLTGIIVVEHHEPYGDFSIEPPMFAAQFVGKDIRDPFRVGVDVDAVSRASISVTSASRAVRNSARRVARAFLTPEGVK